jgi:hypothetical protein
VRPWDEIRKGYTHFADGDVGLAKITPCFENGKSTVFRNLTGGLGSGTTELHVVRPPFVDPVHWSRSAALSKRCQILRPVLTNSVLPSGAIATAVMVL